MGNYQCPKCKSELVFIRWPWLECHKCGRQESLIDFPCSPAYQSHYGRFYGGLPEPTPQLPRQFPALKREPINNELQQLRSMIIDVQKQTAKGKKKPQKSIGIKE